MSRYFFRLKLEYGVPTVEKARTVVNRRASDQPAIKVRRAQWANVPIIVLIL